MKNFKILLILFVVSFFCILSFASGVDEQQGVAAKPVVLVGSTDGSGAFGSTERVRVSSEGYLLMSRSSITIVRKETSQDLSVAALDYTTNFSAEIKIMVILVHASVDITETVTIKINSKTGANYDTIILTQNLSAEQDVYHIPDSDLILESGDEIDINVTNANTTGTVYITVLAETLN